MSNKYQREKLKRRKQLEALGVYYTGQQRIFRTCKGDLDKVDQVIEQLTRLRSPETQKALNDLWQAVSAAIREAGKVLGEVIKKYMEGVKNNGNK